tara:strand:- start:192 stop:554 length:363 start_codon:yes stop_codon:yes gene_type:complete
METNKADYTNTFCHLMNLEVADHELYKDKNFINWYNEWQKRLLLNNDSKEKYLNLMKNTNPIVIPRNHKVEEALAAANKGDLKTLNKLLTVLNKPYEFSDTIKEYQLPSTNENYQTFCGT